MIGLQPVEFLEVQPDPPRLVIPIARLQVVESSNLITDTWPSRADIAPDLYQNADGLWLLSVHRQGTYGEFAIPYIHTEIILAHPELGFIAVLCAFHGTETYGKKRNKHVPKGQFYRYYRQSSSSDWERVKWYKLTDEWRSLATRAFEEHAPPWARSPGKLSSERLPPTPMVATISYKVVRVIEGRYYSLFSPEQEYVLGKRVKEVAKPKHGGGFFSFPKLEMGKSYLASCLRCMPFHAEIVTPQLALLECEIGGHMIDYGHKIASTYLRPVKVLEIRKMTSNSVDEDD